MAPNRPCRVLVVEDNPADVRLLQEAFREAQSAHELYAVKDGEEALDFVFRRQLHRDKPRPDLILLDINLPRKDGHDVLRALKQNPESATIPVIMLSSSGAASDVRRAYQGNASAYVQKPSELDEYFQTVRDLRRFWFNFVEFPQTHA